jgi:hypothetical protein
MPLFARNEFGSPSFDRGKIQPHFEGGGVFVDGGMLLLRVLTHPKIKTPSPAS